MSWCSVFPRRTSVSNPSEECSDGGKANFRCRFPSVSVPVREHETMGEERPASFQNFRQRLPATTAAKSPVATSLTETDWKFSRSSGRTEMSLRRAGGIRNVRRFQNLPDSSVRNAYQMKPAGIDQIKVRPAKFAKTRGRERYRRGGFRVPLTHPSTEAHVPA